MIVKCEQCQAEYDDEFRDTGCPHGTFLANNGNNTFREHPQAYLSTDPRTSPSYAAPLLDMEDSFDWAALQRLRKKGSY